MDAANLIKLGVVDEVLPEPRGGAHHDQDAAIATLKKRLVANLKQLEQLEPEKRLQLRYDKYRRIGQFLEK